MDLTNDSNTNSQAKVSSTINPPTNLGSIIGEYTAANNTASKMIKRSSSLGVGSDQKPATTKDSCNTKIDPAVNTSIVSR